MPLRGTQDYEHGPHYLQPEKIPNFWTKVCVHEQRCMQQEGEQEAHTACACCVVHENHLRMHACLWPSLDV